MIRIAKKSAVVTVCAKAGSANFAMMPDYKINVQGVFSDEQTMDLMCLPTRTARSTEHTGLTRAAGIIQRSGTFLIDRDGMLLYAQTSVNPQGSFNRGRVLRALEALSGSEGQAASEFMPGGWSKCEGSFRTLTSRVRQTKEIP